MELQSCVLRVFEQLCGSECLSNYLFPCIYSLVTYGDWAGPLGSAVDGAAAKHPLNMLRRHESTHHVCVCYFGQVRKREFLWF